MKLRTKLLLGFMGCSVILLMIGIAGYVGVVKIDGHVDEISGNRLPSIYNLEIINEAQTAVKAANSAMMIPGIPADQVQRQKESIKDAFDRVDKAWKVYDPLPQTKEEAVLWKQFVPEWEQWKKDVQAFQAKSDEYRKTGSKESYEKMLQFGMANLTKSFRAAEETLGKIIDLNDKVAKEETAAASKVGDFLRVFIIITIIAGLMAAVAIALFLTRNVTRQLGGDPAYVEEIASTVAAGDLAIDVKTDNASSNSVLAAMKTMVDNLRTLVSQVTQASASIASASVQLSATSDQIATGSEEVASQVGTVATASEEMAATSTSIAENCLQAAENAKSASESAESGSDVVRETISGMERISASVNETAQTVGSLGSRSDQIGEIVGTIEDIADQTNLLALNAAIEAARAGEQGRGFAVVADEVRALAERTTKATKEIGQMIKAIQAETQGAVSAMENMVSEVEGGIMAAAKSGEALESILSKIHETTQQVNQIATAAEQQTATTLEITSNINQITDVVHESAKGAGETSGAASQLARSAEELQEIVGRFRLSA